jgi:hypothetical protein
MDGQEQRLGAPGFIPAGYTWPDIISTQNSFSEFGDRRRAVFPLNPYNMFYWFIPDCPSSKEFNFGRYK